jgi:DNA-binding transcriptional MerR regulator
VSPKALRLYAANGLLMPAHVDRDSGYRYYRPEQLPTARIIGLLRTAGMPLREIARFLADPAPGALGAYERRLESELDDRREILRYVQQILEEAPMFDVSIKTVQKYMAKTQNVRIPDLSPFITTTIGELWSDTVDGAPFCVFHGQVNERDDGPVEVGVPRSDGDSEFPARDVAYTAVLGEQGDFPQILGAYDAIARWVKENGRDFAGPPREIYLSGPDEPIRWEVAWPLAS